ncbi:MAG: hypothetical protein PHX83_14590 [Acidobacteriia bacterium]|nr:hypothetical protein [Terriglobia bacterium]
MKAELIRKSLDRELAIIDSAIESSELFDALPGDENDKRAVWGGASELVNGEPSGDEDDPELFGRQTALAARIRAIREKLAADTKHRRGSSEWEDALSRWHDLTGLELADLRQLREATLVVYQQAVEARQLLDAAIKRIGRSSWDDYAVEDEVWTLADPEETSDSELKKAKALNATKFELVDALRAANAAVKKTIQRSDAAQDDDLPARFRELVLDD